MFCYNQRVTGIQNTSPMALAAMSAILSPAILVLSRPLGLVPVSVAFAFSAICATLSWFNWKRYSGTALAVVK